MQKWLCSFLFIMLVLVICTPVFAQQATPPATPDPQAVLAHAEQVATMSEAAAQQTSRTMATVQFLAWIFGGLLVVASVFLGLYGFNTQRSIQDIVKEYRTQLEEGRTAYQKWLAEVQAEEKKIQATATQMNEKVVEIERIRQELSTIRHSMTEEFTAAKQALVLLAMGNRLFQENKRAEAIDVYQEARRLQPEDAEINYRLGRAYSNAGRYADAIKALETVVYTKPAFAEANMELGLTYRRHAEQLSAKEERLAEYRLAERYLKRAIQLRTGYADALGALGGLYRREGRYAEALHYYEQAIQGEANSSYALNNIASLAWFLGKTAQARETYTQVEKVASDRINANVPESFWDYYDRALARLVLGQRDEALADHRKAIAQTPEQENFHSVLEVLRFLHGAKEPIPGLDEFIALVEAKLPESARQT